MVTAVTHLLALLLAATTGVWPLDPRPEVAAGFAPPSSTYGAGHRGVDLRGSAGQQVRAAQAGVVTFAGSLAGRGVVVVSHGATRTTYEPVTAIVGVGTQVVAGQAVGTLQRFSSHCWPEVCLHWGLLAGEVYLDPLSLVGAGPVRLLPLAGLPAASPWAGVPRVFGHGPLPDLRAPAPVAPSVLSEPPGPPHLGLPRSGPHVTGLW